VKTIVIRKRDGRCGLCNAGEETRAKVEAVYLRMAQKLPDEIVGYVLTWEQLAERASLLSGRAISARSLRRHFIDSQHSEIVGEAEAEAVEEKEKEQDAETEQLLAAIDEQLGRESVSPGAVVELTLRRFMLEQRREILSGKASKLTPEQASRVAAISMKAKEEGDRQHLLESLTGGISLAFKEQDALRAAEAEAGDESNG